MKGFLDSSAVLRYMINDDPILSIVPSWSWVGASELLYVEIHRVMERVMVQKEISREHYTDRMEWFQETLAGVFLIPVSQSIIRRASRSYPVLLKTLDALHLATLEYVSESDHPDEWTLLSADSNLSKAAKLLGYRTA